MSDRWPSVDAYRKARRVAAISAVFVSAIATLGLSAKPAHAADWVDVATAPALDPLLTRPPLLDQGAVLPGDATTVPCAGIVEDELAAPLTLARAVDLALCHNPQLKGSWAAIKVQAAGVGEARAAYLPTLSLSAGQVDDRTRYPGSTQASTDQNNQTVYGTFTWRLFDFGGRGANRRAANDQLQAALATHDATLQKTLTSVIGGYFDAQTACAAWRAKQQNETLARETLEAAQRREGRGAGAQSDTLQAATALAKVTLDKSRAQGAYQRALAVLIYALGEPASARLTLAEDLTDSTEDLQQDLDGWLTRAQTEHPAIVAARAQLDAAKEKVVSVRSEGLPTLDLTANYYQNGYPNQGLTAINSRQTLIGVTLNVPLFDGFARTYKIRGAQAQVEQQEAALADTEQQTLMEVAKAYADAQAAIGTLEASLKLLNTAQDALSSVRRKFDKGATDILEILSTQAALSDAQQERIRCLADWRSARLRLMASAGALGLREVGAISPLPYLPAALTTTGKGKN